MVLDPTDGKTFWAANEYIGADGDTDIWRTHITSFSLPPAVDNDWYSINVAAGNSLDLQTYTPSDGPGEFVNTASLEIELYDTFGNLVATGTKLPDGRNVSLSYNAPISGQYHVRVFNDAGYLGRVLPVGRRPRNSRPAESLARSSTTSTATGTSIRASRASRTGRSMSSTPVVSSSPRR